MILVVDDHDDARELVCELLSWQGAYTIPARSAAQALQILGGARVDAIVTDYAMPGIDGLTLVRRVRAGDRNRDVPVVMLSGQATPDVQREVERLGGVYLPKPNGLEVLVATVEGIIAGTRDLDAVG